MTNLTEEIIGVIEDTDDNNPVWTKYSYNDKYQSVTPHTFKDVNVWVCSDTGQAYNFCQCSDEAEDGDILYIPSENVVGVVHTWPIAVTRNAGELHQPDNWDNIRTPSDVKAWSPDKAIKFARKYEPSNVDPQASKSLDDIEDLIPLIDIEKEI